MCYDFTTLYTTLPHNLIKEKLSEFIKQTFYREGFLYLALIRNVLLKDIMCGHVRKFVMLSIIFWTVYL